MNHCFNIKSPIAGNQESVRNHQGDIRDDGHQVGLGKVVRKDRLLQRVQALHSHHHIRQQ